MSIDAGAVAETELASTLDLTGKTVSVRDSTFTINDNADNSKKLAFECSGITTSTTRTLTIPDVSGTIYVTGGADVVVSDGGTGTGSFTAYSVICAGTTSTGALQNVSGLGNAGEVLTSNGAGSLPTWQTAGSSSFSVGKSYLIGRQLFSM
jgi:hypothetical protein